MIDLFASQDINWWTGVVWTTCGLLWCFYQLFGLSFWRHPFTAEDPLVSKWCKATFLQICSDEDTNLDGLRVSTSSVNFHFCWTIPLTHKFVFYQCHISCNQDYFIEFLKITLPVIPAQSCLLAQSMLIHNWRVLYHSMTFTSTYFRMWAVKGLKRNHHLRLYCWPQSIYVCNFL